MKIMVFDVPAEHGGALSILNEFYSNVEHDSPNDIEWIFVISVPQLSETSKIKVLQFPWVKKSWVHRLYFDYFIAPSLVNRCKVDKVFSLQNVIIPRIEVPQILYVHQPLPFVEYRFKLRENKIFWIYQNILSRNIIKSIKKSVLTIVQTQWMKTSIEQKVKIQDANVAVIAPTNSLKIDRYFKLTDESARRFFYPAGASFYKNHRLIVETVAKLKSLGIEDYEFIFTLNGDEDEHITSLYKKVKSENLSVKFIGSIPKGKVFEYYASSIMIFPSYIETYGLPLLESKMHQGIIFAADTEFSREILDGYPNAYFFAWDNANQLLDLILNYNKTYIEVEKAEVEEKSTLLDFIINSN